MSTPPEPASSRLDEIADLIATAAEAPGERTQTIHTKAVSAAFEQDLGAYLAKLASNHGVDISVNVSPQQTR